MPSTRDNALADFGLAPNPTGPGNVAYDYANPGGVTPSQGVAGPAGAPTMASLNNLLGNINQTSNTTWNTVPTTPGGTITIPPMPTFPSDQGAGQQTLNNILTWGQGQISPGTTNTIEAAMAERGAGGGFGVDSANTNAAMMRALGLTSEGLQQQAQGDYSNYMNTQLGQEALQQKYWADQLQAAEEQARLQEQYYAVNERNWMPVQSGMQVPGNRGNMMTFPGSGPTPPPSTTPSPTPYPTPAPTPTDPNYDPNVNPFDPLSIWGMDGTDSWMPDNTYYNAGTDTMNYDYGLGNYYG